MKYRVVTLICDEGDLEHEIARHCGDDKLHTILYLGIDRKYEDYPPDYKYQLILETE